jgi:hypothetical protein
MATVHRAADCTYELDQQLTITAVGAGWDEFALENGAPELTAPAPIGRPLMIFVTDATTVHLYEQLFQRAARIKRPITFPIRCDSPELRRYLDLTIIATANGRFSVSTSLVRLESRARLPLFAAAVRHEGSLVMCAWCKRASVEERWVELEEAVSSLRLFERRHQPLLQHGICADCHRRMLSLLETSSAPGRTRK